jgi:uncharacterized membrane protein
LLHGRALISLRSGTGRLKLASPNRVGKMICRGGVLLRKSNYNLIAGQSVDRLAAPSDGVFAVAMTLLVLDLKIAVAEMIGGEHQLRAALLALLPRLAIFLLSFILLGIFWVGQQTQLNHLARSDRGLAWIHLGFLFFVCLTPFSTSLMAEFIFLRSALLGHPIRKTI